MAQIRFSNLVNDIRGASGGNTFSRARSGAIVSARRSPRSVKAVAPGTVKVPMVSITRLWRNLSSNDQIAWHLLADDVSLTNRLGIPRNPSGFEIFTIATYYRMVANLPFLPGPVIARNFPVFRSQNARYSILLNQYFHDVPSQPFPSVSTLTYVTRAFPQGQKARKSAAYKLANISFAPRMVISQFSGSFIPANSPLVTSTPFGHVNVKFVTVPASFNWPIRFNIETALILPV